MFDSKQDNKESSKLFYKHFYEPSYAWFLNTHNFTRMEIWPSQPLNMKLDSMIYNVH